MARTERRSRSRNQTEARPKSSSARENSQPNSPRKNAEFVRPEARLGRLKQRALTSLWKARPRISRRSGESKVPGPSARAPEHQRWPGSEENRQMLAFLPKHRSSD